MIGLIGLGAGTGALVRFEITKWFKRYLPSRFPWGTLTINGIACFFLGWLSVSFMANSSGYALLGIGFCGGMSTFSTMIFEAFGLFRSRWVKLGFIYLLATMAVGFMAVILGIMSH